MKKLIAMVLAAVLALAFVGCAGEQAGANGDERKDTQSRNDVQETENRKPEESPAGALTEATLRDRKPTPEENFTWKKCDGGVAITDYVGDDDVVVIPDTISGEPVVEVYSYIFANDSTVRAVVLPETVKELQKLFANNNCLEIVICEGAQAIEDGAFVGCTNLHMVVLGRSLKSIGTSAFGGCSALKELHISETMETIDGGWSVFWGCNSLTIYGKKGSYIETFCAEYEVAFVEE